MFFEALFTIAKILKQQKHTLKDEWIKKREGEKEGEREGNTTQL